MLLLLAEKLARVKMLGYVFLDDRDIAVSAFEKLPTLVLSRGMVLELDRGMEAEVAYVTDVLTSIFVHLEMIVQV